MAAAVAHLHRRGVMHGDFYAHNILWDPANGQSLLSDFGAGTLLPVDQSGLSRALQALEVRAFGYLLEELVAQAAPEPERASTLAAVDALVRACLHSSPVERPVMADVADSLVAL